MATPVDKKTTQPISGSEQKMLVIVGPTASGKSDLALQLARALNGEIICADSRTIYKNMDIGTAKPSASEQQQIVHWGLNLVEPGDIFTAADFKSYAQKTITAIRSRGHLPIIVGGSGLYIDGLVFDYEYGQPQLQLRQELEQKSLSELQAYCANNNIELPQNENNRRYVIRAIEQKSINNKRRMTPIANCTIVGITTTNEQLRSKIDLRIEQMFEQGVVDEAKMLVKIYGWDSPAMTANIYRLIKQFLDGDFDEAELKHRAKLADWHLAKRQRTWFKRNEFIHWFTAEEAFDATRRLLEQNDK